MQKNSLINYFYIIHLRLIRQIILLHNILCKLKKYTRKPFLTKNWQKIIRLSLNILLPTILLLEYKIIEQEIIRVSLHTHN